MTILALGLFPVVVSLGIWQLSRAEEKRVLIAEQYARMGALPAAEELLLRGEPYGEPLPFTRVRLEGRFDEEQVFLMDNQIMAGTAGYAVLHVFVSTSGRRYLVNRGWIAAPARRDALPDPGVPATRSITVLVWPFTGLAPIFVSDTWGEQWPKRIQRLELDRMAQTAGLALVAELRLEDGQAGMLTPMADATTLNPGKNTGYAAQWFGIGLVLLTGWLAFGVSQGRKDEG
jgi:cytochrome oxidase assembly protein ShyY1